MSTEILRPVRLVDLLLAQEISTEAVEALIARMDERTPQYVQEIGKMALLVAATLPTLLSNPHSNTTPGAYNTLAERVGKEVASEQIGYAWRLLHVARFNYSGGWRTDVEEHLNQALEALENVMNVEANMLRRLILLRLMEYGYTSNVLQCALPLATEMRRARDPFWPRAERIVLLRLKKIEDQPGLLRRIRSAQSAFAGRRKLGFHPGELRNLLQVIETLKE